MSSKTKTETQSKIKDYTNWQLEEDLEKMYDTMGFDDNGKVLTREEKYQRMLKERANELTRYMALLKLKERPKWAQSFDTKIVGGGNGR